MSLYDDVILPEFAIKIPPAVVTQSNNKNTEQNQPSTKTKHENEIASWNNNSLKLLQNQVEAAKKRQQTFNSASYIKANLKSTLNASPVLGIDKRKPLNQIKKDSDNVNKQVQSNGSELRFNLITGKVEKEDSLIASVMEEEYDPMRPNEYEKVIIELKKIKNKKRHSSSSSRSGSRSRRRRRSRSSSRTRSSSRGRKRRSRRSSEEDAKKFDSKIPEEPAKKYNSFAPPPSLIESDAKSLVENPDEVKPTATTAKLNVGLFKAEKMMAKMGYKEGEGLGKNNQGMSMALQVEKTGRRSGRIIHEKDVPIEPPTPINSAVISAAPVIIKNPVIHKDPSTTVGIPPEVMKNMSKVILLKNMVIPSEVDEDLEGETKEECQKYGEVNSCVIYVMDNKSEEEAVRIFVEFKTLPSAIKALTDLNGRFFGGRVVKATFYNLDKFKRRELSDDM